MTDNHIVFKSNIWLRYNTFLHIPDSILKEYVFNTYLHKLFSTWRAKWYAVLQEQWTEQRILV